MPAQAAYLLDSFLAKAVYRSLLYSSALGFACAVPAIMSARTITDPRRRLVTIAIVHRC